MLDWLAKLPDSLKGHCVSTIKNSKTTSLFRVAFSDQPSAVSNYSAFSTPHSALCIKRYNYQNFFYSLKYIFRSSRAKKAWKKANALLLLGILTPSPVAFLEKRSFLFLYHSLFITTWIDGAFSLDRFFEDNFGQAFTGDPLKGKWQFIAEAARYIKTIHDLQVAHGDLKAKNILVKLTEGKYVFYLLDLDSLKIKNSLGRKERIRDLARLNASFLNTRILSRSNRLRFLVNYIKGEAKPDSAQRIFWKHIVAATENTLRKSKKRFM
jgi:tRNA A-37 threonylcarbamoyl transferase component Bud32